MQCNAMQYNITIQFYNITADLLQIICRHAAFIRNSSTSETATRTASFPLHVIPFSLQKRLMLLELKPRCSGYVVSKTSAKSSTVFSFLDTNSNSIEKTGGVDLPLPKPENDVPDEVCANVTFFGKWKTKFVSKCVFRLSRARKTIGPLINLKYMLILFSKLFSKIEKRKTEIDD